jgi:hypothetical protein
MVDSRHAEKAMHMAALKDLARVVRSKNAGPTQLTLDIFFKDAAAYALACRSAALHSGAVAHLYGVDAAQVQRYLLPELSAIKFSLPRRCAGGPGDGDLYGAQQHAPLLELAL